MNGLDTGTHIVRQPVGQSASQPAIWTAQ